MSRHADGLTQLDEVVRFVTWAHELETFPSADDVIEHFGVTRAVANDWRKSLARAHGLKLPAGNAGVPA